MTRGGCHPSGILYRPHGLRSILYDWQLLEAKGVISDQDYVQLTQPQVSSPAPQGHGRVWTWDEIDANQRSPIRNQGD